MTWSVLTIMSSLDAGKRVEFHLARQGYEFYNPKTQEWWVVKGRKVQRTVQLFPSYLFCNVITQWRALLGTVGVTGVIRDKDGPLSVSDDLIARLRCDEQDGLYLPTTEERFIQGQRVRLTNDTGSWADHIAIYEGMKGEDRCSVLLQLLGKQVRLVVPEVALAEII